MIVHRPFLELRWVWAKALLGFSMFEATLALVLARARSVAEEAVMLASGAGDPAALASMIAYERPSLYAILALSSAQVVLGVWRPGLRRPLKSEPSPSNP